MIKHTFSESCICFILSYFRQKRYILKITKEVFIRKSKISYDNIFNNILWIKFGEIKVTSTKDNSDLQISEIAMSLTVLNNNIKLLS